MAKLVYIAMEDCEEPLPAKMHTVELCSQGLAAVRAMQQLGVQHCAFALHNFPHSCGRVVLCDNSNVARAAPDESLLKAEATQASWVLYASEDT